MKRSFVTDGGKFIIHSNSLFPILIFQKKVKKRVAVTNPYPHA